MKRILLVVAAAGCYRPPAVSPLVPGEVAIRARGARAKAPTEAGWKFDVDAAIAYARLHGPSAADHRDLVAVADAEVDASGQLTNPEIRVGRTFDTELGAIDRVFVALRLHPDQPWARAAAVAEARSAADEQRARSRLAERETARQIRRLYAILAFGDATRASLARQLAVLEERQKLLAAQLQRATATQLDLVIADEELADLELARGNLEVQMARARSELSLAVGIPPGQAWTPTWDLAGLRTIETSFDRDALTSRVLAAHPELAALGAEVQRRDARAYHERALRWPWIDTFQVERSVRDTAQWAVSLQVTLPLFSLNGGKIAAADAEAHRVRAERQRLAARTLQDLDAAVDLARATGERARVLADRMPILAQAVTDLVAQAKASSAVDPVKLLLVQERQGRAERAMLSAALDHRLALIALGALIGDDR